MRRCGKRPQSSRGTSRTRSRSIFTGILLAREAESLRKPPHVGVDDDALGMTELAGDDVRGLPGDAGQPHELVDRPRDAAVVLLDQHPHRSAQGARLLPEEARRVDVALELLLGHGKVVLRPPVLPEELLRDAIDVHVGRLRREHHGDEQLELRARAQGDGRVRVRSAQARDRRADSLPLRPHASSGLPRRSYAPTAVRRRVPAQTTSSAGQSAHARSLGVGTNAPARMRPIAAESCASSCGTSPDVNTVTTGSSGCSRNW